MVREPTGRTEFVPDVNPPTLDGPSGASAPSDENRSVTAMTCFPQLIHIHGLRPVRHSLPLPVGVCVSLYRRRPCPAEAAGAPQSGSRPQTDSGAIMFWWSGERVLLTCGPTRQLAYETQPATRPPGTARRANALNKKGEFSTIFIVQSAVAAKTG
jgi:hypothetical protein